MNKFFTQNFSNTNSTNLCFNKFVFAVVATFTLLIANPAFADGTKQVSPGNGAGVADANGTALLVSPTQGSRPGSLADSKMYVRIQNFSAESIYAGLMARTFFKC